MLYHFLILIFYLQSLVGQLFMDDTTCACLIDDLNSFEQKTTNTLGYRRLRIQYKDNLRKYHVNISSRDNVECYTMVVYERQVDATNGKIDRQCVQCLFNATQSYWSSMSACMINHCDRDLLIGNPTLFIDYDQVASQEQQLFEANRVVAVYKYGEERQCKICQMNGEWSKYSYTHLCNQLPLTTPKANTFCRLSKLKELESNQTQYVRLRIEVPTGLHKYTLSQAQFLINSIVVYQTYEFLNVLNTTTTTTTTATSSSTSINKYASTYTLGMSKYCRYCDANGVWSDLEECVQLKCDRDLLTGEPELYFHENNVKPPMQQTLFEPFSTLAVSTFSGEKFCKQCNENGEWSKFALNDLCSNKLQPPKNYVALKQRQPKLLSNSTSTLAAQTKQRPLIQLEENLSNKSTLNASVKCNLNDVKLRLVSYFVFAVNGSKLSESDRLRMVNVVKSSDCIYAVYDYFNDKYCKQCELDGTWSKYQDKNICKKVKWKL